MRTIQGSVVTAWSFLVGLNLLTINVSFPPGVRLGEVSVPRHSMFPSASCIIKEGGVTVWQNGAFVPGTPGVWDGYDNMGRVTLVVGSGTYSFVAQDAPQL